MSKSYYATQQEPSTSGQNERTAPDGTPIGANPGKRAMVPINKEVVGTSIGGAKLVGIGAQVGILRSLEFSAGGRAHRISTGPYTQA